MTRKKIILGIAFILFLPISNAFPFLNLVLDVPNINVTCETGLINNFFYNYSNYSYDCVQTLHLINLTSDNYINATTINATNGYFSNNVGIGTTSPSAKLEIYNSPNRNIRIDPGRALDVDGYPGLIVSEFVPGIYFNDKSASATGWIAFANGNKFYITNYTGSAQSSSNIFSIDNSGNVGIGTASPSYPLSVTQSGDGSTAEFKQGIRLLPNSVGYTFLSDAAGASALFINANDDGTSSQVSGSYPSWGIQMWTTGDYFGIRRKAAGSGTWSADYLRIVSSGNVGIGTTSPNYLLDIFSANPCIHLNETDYGNNDYKVCVDNGNFVISETGAGAADDFTIYNNGYVGIGTTSPNTKLDISGNITALSPNGSKFCAPSNTGGWYAC